MQGNAADELDIEMDHFPEDGMIANGNGGAAEPAGGIFDHGVGIGQDAFEELGAGPGEFEFGLVEGGLGGLDRLGSGLDGGWEFGEFLAQRGEAQFQGLGGAAEILQAHAFDHGFGGGIEEMVAGKVGLPLAGEFAEFVFGLRLEFFFKVADAGHRRADAADFALVFAADDFLENPLDHVRDGVGRRGRRAQAIHATMGGCKR